MKIRTLVPAVFLLASPAFAQQSTHDPATLSRAREQQATQSSPQLPDASVLQKILASVRQQRDDAMDKAALAEARAAQLAEELQRVKVDALKGKEVPKEPPQD